MTQRPTSAARRGPLAPARPLHGRGPLWLWVLVCALALAGTAYLRLVKYPHEIVPIAYTLPLLIFLWYRDLRLMWGMAAAFTVMVVSKLFVLLDHRDLDAGKHIAFSMMQAANVLIPAAVIHAVVRVTERLEAANGALERTNAELEASNEELAAREEEITQQNEELQSQAEELEQQMEELSSQAEELQMLNEQLAVRERTLDDLLESSVSETAEAEVLDLIGGLVQRLLGHRACAAAILEPGRDGTLTVRPLTGMADGQPGLPRDRTIATLALTRNRAAYLADLAMRPDLRAPVLEGGRAPASVLTAPVRTGELRGSALEFYSTEAGDWTEYDLRIAQWLADHAGRLLSYLRLRADVERQRELLRTVTDHASAALLMTDAEGRCTYMNPAAERLIGRDPAACYGRTIHDLLHGNDGSCGHGPAECPLIARSGHALGAPCDDTLLHPSGERIPLVCTATPVRYGGGVGAVVIELRDVREQRRAEREREALLDAERAARAGLERAARAKDEFVATLSHELRTPLNAILGWATLLRRGPSGQDLEEGLAVIERNARHQAQLISDLLDISRITAGKIRLDVRPVDLAQVAESAVASLRPTAEAKGVAMITSIAPMDRAVVGDPERLQQVLWNLLTNAVKFTPGGGRVELTISRVASYVQISVADTGIGIDPAIIPQLFERYRQADATSSSRRHGGLGLGLAIVKHLVELHGGSVHARSDGPGTGATFSVLLPVRAVDLGDDRRPMAHAAHDGAPISETPSLAGIRVLAVDDEADARSLIRRVLEERGAAVLTASSADEAIDVLDRERPHLIVSDIGMPGADGFDLIRRVRQRRPHDLPAIALTAFARPQDRARALLAGFQSHIAKPVDAIELVAAVATLASRASHPDPS